MQIERGALPSQAVFLPGDSRAAYMAAEPANDAQFIAAFAHSLEHSGGYALDDATRAAGGAAAGRDALRARRPASYPSNGRRSPTTSSTSSCRSSRNGKAKTDGVGPHRDLLAEFPFVGPPHNDATTRLAA